MLLILLVQLTGELHWLEEPYHPDRARGGADNDTAGLPDAIQTNLLSKSCIDGERLTN